MSSIFRYGDPSSQSSLSPRPPCWGTSRYDNEDRECRACGFQHTCRDQISKSLKPAQSTISYYEQYRSQQIQKVATPQVLQVKPQAAPQLVQPVSTMNDKYGQFQDPMFMSIKSTPSIMRPQLPGESFGERITKNVFLSAAESALGELVLAVRQLLWAPKDIK